LKHLNTETTKVIDLSLERKIDWVRKDHFVMYEKAEKIKKVIKKLRESNINPSYRNISKESSLPYNFVIRPEQKKLIKKQIRKTS